ncbi:hypothetical protein evm_005291 [Chilo suppressalis]|nr:hypothetical protein evm_015041 [Chilo suppressalis]RVE50085.1 hypothetical protein evm_005291 [Chilo suppressalis]
MLLSSHIPHKNSEIECTNSVIAQQLGWKREAAIESRQKRAPKSHDYHEEPPRPPITRISLPPDLASEEEDHSSTWSKNRVCPSMSAAARAVYTKHTTGRGSQFRTFVLMNSPSLKSAWRGLS